MVIKKAAVIGHPVSHSLSPEIHDYWIEKYSIHANYGRVEIVPEMLQHGVKQLRDSGYVGFNVTLPHKQEMVQICDEVEDEVRHIGAVNTVVIIDKKLKGFNTDAEGFRRALSEGAPKFKIKGSRVLVLGAGGAARAVVYALKSSGAAEIRICNRTTDRAQKLAAAHDASFVHWDDHAKSMENIDLLVNTTSAGMKGREPLNIDLYLLPQAAVVCDIVYTPRQTPLLQAAAARGNVTVGGLGMLLHQAALSFEHWFGKKPEVTEELVNKIGKILEA